MDVRTIPAIDPDVLSQAFFTMWVLGTGGGPDVIYRGNVSDVLGAAMLVDVEHIAGTTYTLQQGDDRKYLRAENAAGCVITIPEQATVPFLEGTLISVRAATAGPVSFSPESGAVTLNPPGGPTGPLTFAEEGSVVQALLVDAVGEEWDIIGGTQF